MESSAPVELDDELVMSVGKAISNYIRKGPRNDQFQGLFEELSILSNDDDHLVARIVSTVDGLPARCGIDGDDVQLDSGSELSKIPKNHEDKEPRPTMLAKIVYHEYVEIFEALLRRYPNMDLEHHFNFHVDGETLLFFALNVHAYKIARLLLVYGANVNCQTATGSTCIRSACYDNNIKAVQMLIKFGADVNIGNIYNNTPLMGAALKGNHPICQLLIECGADVDAVSNCKSNALHYAAKGTVCHKYSVKALYQLLMSNSKKPRDLLVSRNDQNEPPYLLIVGKLLIFGYTQGIDDIFEDDEHITLSEKIEMNDFLYAWRVIDSPSSLSDIEFCLDVYLARSFMLRSAGGAAPVVDYELNYSDAFNTASADVPRMLLPECGVSLTLQDFYDNIENVEWISTMSVNILKHIFQSSPSMLGDVLLRRAKSMKIENPVDRHIQHKVLSAAIQLRQRGGLRCARMIRQQARSILAMTTQSRLSQMKYAFDIIDLIKEGFSLRPRFYGYDVVRYFHNTNPTILVAYADDFGVPEVDKGEQNEENLMFNTLIELISFVLLSALAGDNLVEKELMVKNLYDLNQMRITEMFTGGTLLHAFLSCSLSFRIPPTGFDQLKPMISLCFMKMLHGSDLSACDILYNTPMHLAAMLMHDSQHYTKTINCSSLSNDHAGWNDFINKIVHRDDYLVDIVSLKSSCPRYYGGERVVHLDQQNIFGMDIADMIRVQHKCRKSYITFLNNGYMFSKKNGRLTLKCLAAKKVHEQYLRCDGCRTGRAKLYRHQFVENSNIANVSSKIVLQGEKYKYFEMCRNLAHIWTEQSQQLVQLHPIVRFHAPYVWRVMQAMSRRLGISIELLQFIEMHGPCKFVYQDAEAWEAAVHPTE